jgi:hypothetical protein
VSRARWAVEGYSGYVLQVARLVQQVCSEVAETVSLHRLLPRGAKDMVAVPRYVPVQGVGSGERDGVFLLVVAL